MMASTEKGWKTVYFRCCPVIKARFYGVSLNNVFIVFQYLPLKLDMHFDD